jgi:hypothetical protein
MITKCEQGREEVMHGPFQHILSASGLTELTEENKSHTTHCQNVYATDDKQLITM